MAIARPAAGNAGGALSGEYPDNVGDGATLAFGPSFHDDFIRPPDGGYYGDKLWPLQDGTGVATATAQIPTANTEIGICRVSTGAAAVREGAAIGYGVGTDRSFFRSPPIGSVYYVKMRAVDTTQIEISSGFTETHSAVSSPTACDFVGIRGTAGGNWTGVVRNGTTESTQDLGLAVDTNWRIMGFVHNFDDTYQFCYWTTWSTYARRIDVGDPVSATNAPNTNLQIVPIRVVTLDGTDKRGEIDFVGLGGRTQR